MELKIPTLQEEHQHHFESVFGYSTWLSPISLSKSKQVKFWKF